MAVCASRRGRSRHYDAALGRFAQADTIVPDLYNPQSLNRYACALNNPVNYVDPSGHAPQNPGDPDDMQGDCTTAGCWENRWYAAHGSNWDDQNSNWYMPNTPNPRCYDEGITDAVIDEVGISLNNPAGWSWDQKKAIASGMAWFENALSGHIAQLRELVGGTTVFLGSPLACLGNPCAPPGMYRIRSDVYMRNDFLSAYGSNVAPMVFVHELGHIIDWRSSIDINYYRGTFSQAWHGAPLTASAATGNWERFADAIGVYVYGQSYSTWQPLRNVLDIGPQRARMSALLGGLW